MKGKFQVNIDATINLILQKYVQNIKWGGVLLVV